MDYRRTRMKYEDVPEGTTWYSDKLEKYMIKVDGVSQALPNIHSYLPTDLLASSSSFVTCWVPLRPEQVTFRSLKIGDRFKDGWDAEDGEKSHQKISNTWCFDSDLNMIRARDDRQEVTKIG